MGKKEVHKIQEKNNKVLPSAFSSSPVEVNLLGFHHPTSPSKRDHPLGYAAKKKEKEAKRLSS